MLYGMWLYVRGTIYANYCTKYFSNSFSFPQRALSIDRDV